MKNKISYILSAFLVSILSCLNLLVPALAVSDDAPDYKIQVSPGNLRVQLSPGQIETTTFKVQNVGKNPYHFSVGASGFSVEGDGYTPKYDTTTNYNQIVDWIEFSQTSGYLEPDDEVEITVTFIVPVDVPDGGQYAMIFAQIEETEQMETGVALVRRIGIVTYAEMIGGDTRIDVEILTNNIPNILFNPPIIATSTIRNDGNVHGEAQYRIDIYNALTGELVHTNEDKPASLIILPETTRTYTATWAGTPKLGIFKVRHMVTIYDEESVKEQLVFVCPIWLIIVIILLIALIIYWLITRSKELADKNRARKKQTVENSK